MPPKAPSPLYLLGLGIAAGGVVLLPAIYVGLTAFLGFNVFHFATHHFPEIWAWPVNGRGGLLIKSICSFTPLVVGLIVTAFMVKPIFARRGRQMQPITLNREHEPLIFAVVEQICAIVGAPLPREIRLDHHVNASAGFRRGFLSFLENDFVLTIGAPLLAGLSVKELAGVIAHEFGHFRQGAAMRLSYIIRRVNHWFARVIYERDAWDETLDEWSSSDDWWVNFMLGCARVGVWISRLVLKGLMYVGHAFTSFLMRQMEYDADRCEIFVSGSEGFESTLVRMEELGSVLEHLHREMKRTWDTSFRLPDNLPLLVAHHASHLSDGRRAALAADCFKRTTGWLDTHPANADRVSIARRLHVPGFFSDDAPASDLLENFVNLAKFVTLAHYEDDLQIPTTDDFLIPVEAVLQPPQPTTKPPPVPMMQAPTWKGRPE